MLRIASNRASTRADRNSPRSLTSAVLAFALCASAFVSSTLVSSTVAFGQAGASSLPASNTISPAPPASINPAPHTPHRAEVTYNNNLLTVVASNSSLNQIMREIARQTGMKISGGVSDDRVFGTYGPASPSAVLATLLDGTGSNVLLVQNASHTPTELILTPRIGGVTPPNPNASGFDDGEDSDETSSRPVPLPVPQPSPSQVNSRAPFRTGTGGVDTNPAATAPSSTSQQVVFPPVNDTITPATATTTPTSPDPSADTVKTPQQIFEQLQRLRQQSTQQPKTPQ